MPLALYIMQIITVLVLNNELFFNIIIYNVYSCIKFSTKKAKMSKFFLWGAFSWFALPYECQLLELLLLELDNKITVIRVFIQSKVVPNSISEGYFFKTFLWGHLPVCFSLLLNDFH